MNSNRGYRGNRGGRYNGNFRGGSERNVQYIPPFKRTNFKASSLQHSVSASHVRPLMTTLLDEDVDMLGGPSSTVQHTNRFVPYNKRGRGKGFSHAPSFNNIQYVKRGRGVGYSRSTSSLPNRGFRKPHQQPGPRRLPQSDWYECVIPYGQKHPKETLVKILNDSLALPLQPIKFATTTQEATFFVKDREVAQELRDSSGKMKFPDGYRIIISISPCKGPSTPELTSEVVDNVKICMSNRYNVEAKTLNLSNFSNDPALMSKDIFLMVNRVPVLQLIVSIICDYIPELVALDLSNNRLNSLVPLEVLCEKAPNIIDINLRDNQLRTMEDLRHLQKLQLKFLQLTNNPASERFNEDRVAYVSATRRKFPSLLKLDGVDLPPVVTFDVNETVISELPPSKDSYFADNPSARDLLGLFIKQYTSLYDSDDRNGLVDAYHDTAVFSFTWTYNATFKDTHANFGDYAESGRNLKKIMDNARRTSLLKHGKANVVAALIKLPATFHDESSFKVDIGHLGPTMIVFTLYGMYKERKTPKTAIRQFSRTFIAVPRPEGGVYIINDQLTITNPSPTQARSFQGTPTAVHSPVHVSSLVSSPQLHPDIQKEMIRQFAAQSGMNQKFSQLCLVQNNWDYEAAARSFMAAKDKDQIPRDAFTPDV